MQAFLEKHKLPNSCALTAKKHFNPLVDKLICKREKSEEVAFCIGVNGSQGSGKTTLSDFLALQLQKAGFTACAISIDDFYLTRSARQLASKNIHPLLLTRGVPGTHDIALAQQTLCALTGSGAFKILCFNKATDDRFPDSERDTISAPIDFVILEGWCVITPAQNETQLIHFINTLKRE